MTRTGIFMRRIVCTNTFLHWAAESLSTSPEMSAATNTPVPAADSQLIVKRAAAGLAFRAAPRGRPPLGVHGGHGRHALHEVVQGRYVPCGKRQRPGKRRAEQRRLEFEPGEEIVQERLELRHAPERAAEDEDDPRRPRKERLADAVLVAPFVRITRRRRALARSLECLPLRAQQEAR